MAFTLKISDGELAARRRRVLIETGGEGFVTFNATSIFYLTNFYFLPTERPIGLALTGADHCALFVPRLEQEHGESLARVDRVVAYPEYPWERHPMLLFADLLKDLGLGSGTLVAESDGYGSGQGYQGPRLTEVIPDAKVRVDGKLVERMRLCKSDEEIALIRESCRWGNLAHELLQKYSVPGASEVEISARASHEATMAMLATFGRTYKPLGRVGAFAGFRGQIGANSALPHAVTVNATLRPGDTLVTGAAAGIGGYHSELERTMFVGEPNAEQITFFGHMMNLQQIAFDAIRPGVSCAQVDREVRRYYEEHGLMPYWRHHVGHNIGLMGHEAPFLDTGDETVIEKGMLFTVEPGLYKMGLGGFRHSDTVVVTDHGIEFLTYYPRDLESLICG